MRLVPHFGPVTKLAGTPVARPQPHHHRFGELMTAFTLLDDQQVGLTLTGVDSRGNPAPLPPGSATWSVDNPNVLLITPSADTLSCLIQPVGPLGVANVSVVLVNNGADVATGSLAVTVTNDSPVTIGINPGTPVPLVPPVANAKKP